ncbi:hypothetical protein VaNZ11_003133 [Volvox africanus]|uniref:t-SNARE coiled-coil homology domain-containing protein n=1 Tax=Volvox africanus TaxID=51714 RepID=A0ABQ5RTH0_9CHLO|nr:hypothetical protein VaNZ11_003133 [Volvox africanus]
MGVVWGARHLAPVLCAQSPIGCVAREYCLVPSCNVRNIGTCAPAPKVIINKVIKLAHAVMANIEALDKENEANKESEEQGQGTASERMRTSQTACLKIKLKDHMREFSYLFQSEYQQASSNLEQSLSELHQIFLDMTVLVEAQGEMLDNIEKQVARSVDYVKGGTEALQDAKQLQKRQSQQSPVSRGLPMPTSPKTVYFMYRRVYERTARCKNAVGTANSREDYGDS